jgi:hypothetical protein
MSFEKPKLVIVAALVALSAISASASIRLTGHSYRDRDGAVQDAASHIEETCIRSGAAPYPTYSYTVVETHNAAGPSGSDWYATIETDCQP